MRMRPLSVAERGIETPTVSLAALLAGNRDIGGTTKLRLTDFVEEITASAIESMVPQQKFHDLNPNAFAAHGSSRGGRA
jgi:hypothetical protein